MLEWDKCEVEVILLRLLLECKAFILPYRGRTPRRHGSSGSSPSPPPFPTGGEPQGGKDPQAAPDGSEEASDDADGPRGHGQDHPGEKRV